MLLYYLFWMSMGFILHFYIIFGTNLLTGGPAQIVVFCLFHCFAQKGISNGIQMEQNLRESYFWKKRDPEDLEWTSSNQQGGHEPGGAPTPLGAPSYLVDASRTSGLPLQVSWSTFVPRKILAKVLFHLDSV